jgi:hypothetical protein
MALLQPRDGWRAFAGEVGVIVLGVLIALGAQQAVEVIQMRRDVAAFRQTINTEIAKNLWVYQYRMSQVACVDRKLDDFKRWILQAGDERPVSIERMPLGNTFSLYRSAWDTRDPDVFAALPATDRARYAEFYDELANNQKMAEIEQRAQASLIPYTFKGTLSLADRRALWTAGGQLRAGNRYIPGTYQASFDIARAVGVTAPVKPDGMDQFLKDVRPCIETTGP